jgi:hypothetical protein
MPRHQVVDTFPSFLDCWRRIEGEPVERQVDLWLADHKAHWPELAAKQEADYRADGLDWVTVLRERVFPFLPARLPEMHRAREILLACLEPVYEQAQRAIGLDCDVTFVILAIGYGGWATSYEGAPACLLGLDTIVECGWVRPEALSGLLAHELGHLLHLHRRAAVRLGSGKGALWQVYEEGFAQRCEHLTMGRDSWHMQYHDGGDWVAWCTERRAWLAAEFLRTVEAGEPVYRFFGSWPECQVEGRQECGHFLAHEVIREWEAQMGTEEIARLPAERAAELTAETLTRLAGQ